MLLNKIASKLHSIKLMYKSLIVHYGCGKYYGWGHIGHNSRVSSPSIISGKNNIYIGDNVHIDWDCVLYATNARFEMKSNSGAAVGLTVVTGNHVSDIGERYIEQGNDNLEGKPVVVDEDVWLAANVTLLAGTQVGRGAIIGAGTVVSGNKIPPYAIVKGNPCKIVAFRFTPEEIIEHEKALYPEEERLPLELLEKNYKKYFLDHIKEIKAYTGLICKQ